MPEIETAPNHSYCYCTLVLISASYPMHLFLYNRQVNDLPYYQIQLATTYETYEYTDYGGLNLQLPYFPHASEPATCDSLTLTMSTPD